MVIVISSREKLELLDENFQFDEIIELFGKRDLIENVVLCHNIEMQFIHNKRIYDKITKQVLLKNSEKEFYSESFGNKEALINA
jgi:hypothetical protein